MARISGQPPPARNAPDHPDACIRHPDRVFVLAHMSPMTTLALLETLGEPTRLRIVNCLTAAPLFVSDLQALLEMPQPTISRHLKVLREAGLVRDTPIAQFVLYRLRRPAEPLGRVLGSVLEAALLDPGLRDERAGALERSRQNARYRNETDLEGRPA
jgi:ArsR family transcriptional regulator